MFCRTNINVQVRAHSAEGENRTMYTSVESRAISAIYERKKIEGKPPRCE